MVQVKRDLTGEKFGRLTVIGRAEDKKVANGHRKRGYSYVAMWNCKCDYCGNIKPMAASQLLYNRPSKSCGCRRYYEGIRTQYNKYDLNGEYGIGYLEDGSEFYFDLEDYDLIKDYHWTLHKGYITCHKWSVETKSEHHIKMHRLIMGVVDNTDYRNVQVDHINRNKVDNRKSNLRICNNQQNSHNKSPYRKDGSKIGVKKHKEKWMADITVNGVCIKLGEYDSYGDAVRARIDAEKKYWGEYRAIK